MKKNRESIVVRTSIFSIIANVILASFKALVGLLAHSVAIISDAVNNFSDALSSTLTIIGTKLAGKAPDRKHPYGHGRIEYITSFVVSVIVLYAGITALIEAIKKIIHPEAVNYSTATIIVLIAAILIKFVLGIYVKRKGKTINSTALVASGADAFNDALLSISVLASVIVYMVFHINLEAYVGILLSVFIIKTGLELIKESVEQMLGMRAESTLTKAIKREITKEPAIQGAYDLILNDYGPDKYIGSVHIEVADTLSVTDVDAISRRITKTIANKYGVILHTIGIYSINTKDPQIIQAKEEISKIVFAHSGILEMHGFHFNEPEKTISFDIIIDFKTKHREKVYQAIYDEIQTKYPKYHLNITLDIDVSD